MTSQSGLKTTAGVGVGTGAGVVPNREQLGIRIAPKPNPNLIILIPPMRPLTLVPIPSEPTKGRRNGLVLIDRQSLYLTN